MKALTTSTTGLLIGGMLAFPAAGDVIYSNHQEISIPADFVGVYLDIQTGLTGASDDPQLAGWDINPFFGGVAVANSPDFQPVRVGTGDLASIFNLAEGATIDATATFATGHGGAGYGGSTDHVALDPAPAGKFEVDEEGYIGFRLNGSGYGWMRVVFDGTGSGAVLRDWAYDTGGTAGSIVAGRIRQSAPLAGAQLVTLSPATGESFVLGSQLADTGGNVNSVRMTNGGAVTLTGANTHTGNTVVHAGTLKLAATASIDNSATIVVGDTGSSGAVFDVTATTGFAVGPPQTLMGTGTIQGNVTLAGIHAPGNSVGLQTFADDLAYAANSNFQWELASNTTSGRGTTGFDAVNIAGDLGIDVDAMFSVVLGTDFNPLDSFWLSQQAWEVFQVGGAKTGVFADFQLYNASAPGTPVAYEPHGTFSYAYLGNSGAVTWTPVPEPRTLTLLSLLACGLLCRRVRSARTAAHHDW